MTSNVRPGRPSIAALALSIMLAGCAEFIVDDPDMPEDTADFERAWTVVNSVYPYFTFKQINWDSIHAVYTPRAERARGDRMFGVLFDLLSELKDGHVDLRTQSGQDVRTYTPPRSERDFRTFNPHLVRKYFDRELKLAGGDRIEYEILPDGVGYVRIATFIRGDWVYEIDKVLDFVRDTRGLIIDVRDNGGGSTNMSDVVVSRFITSPLAYYPVYKDGVLIDIPPVNPAGAPTYSQPVVVLINGVCFSTTESFAEMMRQLPNVTLVGDTTGGGGGAPEYYPLPSGREIRVSTKNLCRYDGAPIEWNGVPPDIVVLQTSRDVKNGHDLQLEQADRLLR